MNTKQRLEKINNEDDLEQQIRLANTYAKTMRSKMKSATSFEEKKQLNEKVNQAEKTTREMRRLSFDVEDALRANRSALSVLAS